MACLSKEGNSNLQTINRNVAFSFGNIYLLMQHGMCMKNITKDELIEKYVIQKRTIEDIAKEYNVCRATIERRFKRFGIQTRKHRDRALLLLNNLELLKSRSLGGLNRAEKNRIEYSGIEPDDLLNECLCGCLLGDGSLELGKGAVNARYREGSKNTDYMIYKKDFLSKYFYVSSNERISKPDKRTGNKYKAVFISTRTEPYLTRLYYLWYADKKNIPKEFILKYLTPFALSIWYMDDGNFNNDDKNVSLYTHSFSESDVYFLRDYLFIKYSVWFDIIRVKNKSQWYLRTDDEDAKIFFKIVSPYIHSSMVYKIPKVADNTKLSEYRGDK